MNKDLLRETIRKIVKKKLKEELAKPLASDPANDTENPSDKQPDIKPNPRLDALEKKKVELTGKVSNAKGEMAIIDQRNMSKKQRAQRIATDAEGKLGIVNQQIDREKGKMQETRTRLKEFIKNTIEVMNEKCWDGYHHVDGTTPGEPNSCAKVEEVDNQAQTDECWECYQTGPLNEIECYRTVNWDRVPEGDEHTCEGNQFYEIYGDIKYDPNNIQKAEYKGQIVKLNVPYKNEGYLEEAEYRGRKVSLGHPTRGDVKKSKVFVKKPNGKVVKVNFGDKNMKIMKSSKSHQRSFLARHKCSNPGPRWKAKYWSCKAWRNKKKK